MQSSPESERSLIDWPYLQTLVMSAPEYPSICSAILSSSTSLASSSSFRLIFRRSARPFASDQNTCRQHRNCRSTCHAGFSFFFWGGRTYLLAVVYRSFFLVGVSELHRCPRGNLWLPGPSPFSKGRFQTVLQHLHGQNEEHLLSRAKRKLRFFFFAPSIPSICIRSSALTRLLASCSSEVPLRLHMESISSMKMVVGA